MSKITVQIGFYLDSEHYAQMEAFLPRTQAIKIPSLRIEQRTTQAKQPQQKKKPGRRSAKSELSKSQKSQSKKAESQEQVNEQEQQNMNEMQNEQQEQNEEDQNIEDQQIVEQKVDSEKQEQNLLRYLQDDDDSQDDQDDDDDLDDDLSSISRSMSVVRNNKKTKRQKGDHVGLMQLPDRRPRKDKKLDEATQVIRKEQKERKRKQYLKKQVEAQQKATLDKILNETGRKLKLREQKQNEDERRKQDKQVKNLLDESAKIITLQNKQGSFIMLNKTQLFPASMRKVPQVKIRPECSKCSHQEGRYKIKNSDKFACSLNCYKLLV